MGNWMAPSKTKRISMAVSTEDRATIELGAAIAGISLSRFVVDAGLRAAERILRANGLPRQFSTDEGTVGRGEADALTSILRQGDNEVAQGKVKPVAAVVKRLRAGR